MRQQFKLVRSVTHVMSGLGRKWQSMLLDTARISPALPHQHNNSQRNYNNGQPAKFNKEGGMTFLEDTNYDSSNLLDSLNEKLHLKNDAALCQALEVGAPIISKIRHRKLHDGASMLIRMLGAYLIYGAYGRYSIDGWEFR